MTSPTTRSLFAFFFLLLFVFIDTRALDESGPNELREVLLNHTVVSKKPEPISFEKKLQIEKLMYTQSISSVNTRERGREKES